MRGGRRPGAGRPRTKNLVADIAAAYPSTALKLTPLDWMLMVLNDPTADVSRRDRMAIAAAPYCHQRVADGYLGKKDRAALELQQSANDTAWSALIPGPREKVDASLNAA